MAGLFALLCIFNGEAWAQTNYSILQGATSDTVTHFTIVAKKSETLRFEIVDLLHAQIFDPVKTEKVEHFNSDWVVHRLRVEGLSPQTPYQLRTLNLAGQVVDQRSFKTIDLNAPVGRVALVSCMLRQFHNPFLWNNLGSFENRPDVILILGDSVYLDRSALLTAKRPKNLDEVWEDFVKSRNKLNLYYWQNLVPVISIWDDHDSGGNGVDAKFLLMAQIRSIYDNFFANEEIPGFLTKGPGVSKQFELFGKNFVMMDGRSFRDLDPMHPLFGREQEDWMFKHVKPGANILLNGIQFFGKSLKKDSFEYNWPVQMEVFFQRLRNEGTKRRASFVFGSGDIHFSEVQSIESEVMGYQTAEITSSSAHSLTFPGFHFFRPSNPRREAVTSTHNVVLMDFDRRIHGFNFEVRSLGWRGQTPFKNYIYVGGPCEEWLTPERKAL